MIKKTIILSGLLLCLLQMAYAQSADLFLKEQLTSPNFKADLEDIESNFNSSNYVFEGIVLSNETKFKPDKISKWQVVQLQVIKTFKGGLQVGDKIEFFSPPCVIYINEISGKKIFMPSYSHGTQIVGNKGARYYIFANKSSSPIEAKCFYKDSKGTPITDYTEWPVIPGDIRDSSFVDIPYISLKPKTKALDFILQTIVKTGKAPIMVAPKQDLILIR
ncbi:hypothetical protein SAMN05421780_10775 [Flexibacter flexilis DSM 6793]|uniref:DUF4384 domain-containing protein n=1 Tax=Flexibacter flexilis DSM 6793 TaxID=927664 RepID=A0A1I1KIU3_9BACT|nr:hypothetical protein [Flexibacter flexilis]SFC60485.1 hypothetical protein SAMN05421780_10775 [Flexibacter flexilis DSM 6793]